MREERVIATMHRRGRGGLGVSGAAGLDLTTLRGVPYGGGRPGNLGRAENDMELGAQRGSAEAKDARAMLLEQAA